MTSRAAGRPAVYQLLAAAAPFDAVTGQALALRDALDAAGVASAIAAEHVDPSLAGDVLPLASVEPGATVLLRYSLWSAAADRALEGTAPLGVVYHNITPPEFLGDTNPVVAQLCARGRAELPSVVRRSQLLMADSQFNADELHAVGATDVRLVPLILDLPVPPDAQPAGSDRVLYVGRLAPNKRIEDCIDAIVLLRRRRPEVHLHLVGSGDAFPRYEAALRRHALVSGVGPAVHFHGRLGDDARDALYASSGAYLSLSEHEGFCVPVLEAMARGLPVVARDAGAVRETAGGGALLVTGRNPALAAAALDAALTDPAVREGLARNARRRLAQLDRSTVAARMVGAVQELIS